MGVRKEVWEWLRERGMGRVGLGVRGRERGWGVGVGGGIGVRHAVGGRKWVYGSVGGKGG